VTDPRSYPQGEHIFQLITLWEPNHAGAEERWVDGNSALITSPYKKSQSGTGTRIPRIDDLLD
jgi:hypothetical protein